MLQHFPLHKIDFEYGYNYDGYTLFHRCLQPLVKAKWGADHPANKKGKMLLLKEVRKQTNENFSFLIKTATDYDADISRILARPNGIGETVFSIAYQEFPDESTIKFFADNNVEINYVTLDFNIPYPKPEHASFFIRKGINLKIIGLKGNSPMMALEDFNINNSRMFSPSMTQLTKILPNSAYFSTDEQKCLKNCPARISI